MTKLTDEVKKRRTFAIISHPDAGKTTITNLINRFYDIADGKIRYDGININKIKKSDEDMCIKVKRTEDILKYVSENRTENQYICGFSMETENLFENSRAKLEKKKLDMIAANSLKVEGAGFGVDTNVITLITKDDMIKLPLMSKAEVAGEILSQILKNREVK